MATYEYLCLACEHAFEERRPMGAGSADTALRCPSCDADRVRRRFSMFATGGATPRQSGGPAPTSSGGCCGGGCACGG